MNEIIKESELFEGLEENEIERLVAVATNQHLRSSEYLFLLGDHAESLYVVLKGGVEVCLPLSVQGVMKDIAVETKGPGDALGWSAFVRPYRFTLSARAAGAAELAAFPRTELTVLFEKDPSLGYSFTRHLSELIGRRLLTRQALWTRELQRSLTGSWTVASAETSKG